MLNSQKITNTELISFTKLVEKCLIEQQQSEPSFFQSYDTVVKVKLAFIKDQFFKDLIWPADTLSFFGKIHEILIRKGAVSLFKDLIKTYDCLPIIDFYAVLATELFRQSYEMRKVSGKEIGSSPGIYIPTSQKDDYILSLAILDKTIAEFKSNFEKRARRDGHPVEDYTPLNDEVLKLKSSMLKEIYDSLIGKLSLTNYQQNSIKETIYGFLEARKDARLKTIKNPTVPPANQLIDDILLTPEKYAGGKQMVPAQFKKMYNDVTVEQLAKIALLAQNLYKSEAVQLSEKEDIYEVFPRKIATTFNQFLENSSLHFTADNKNFFMFDLRVEDSKGPDVGIKKVYNPEIPNGYTISNISEKIKSPEARELIKELQSFGNYIRYQKPADVLGVMKGISGITGALSKLGGPTMKM
jgi:hypothetical protein